MTNTQLKSQIDLAITNKVLTSSISPTDVGNSMKDVVDYADQQDLLAMHLNGTEIVTGTKIFNVPPTDSSIILNNTSNDFHGMVINNTGQTQGLNIVNGGDGTGLSIITLNGSALYVENNYLFDGIAVVNSTSGNGMTINNIDIGNGLSLLNPGSGMAIYVNNMGTGAGLVINNTNGNSFPPVVIQKEGIDVVTVSDLGDVLASSFVKDAGTNKEYLMADGSVTIAPYKSYVALISQVGTNPPVPIVLHNDTGASINWSYGGVGIYSATASSPVFIANSTAVFTTRSTGAVGFGWVFSGDNSATTICNFTVQNDSGGGNDRLSNAAVEIRIYN